MISRLASGLGLPSHGKGRCGSGGDQASVRFWIHFCAFAFSLAQCLFAGSRIMGKDRHKRTVSRLCNQNMLLATHSAPLKFSRAALAGTAYKVFIRQHSRSRRFSRRNRGFVSLSHRVEVTGASCAWTWGSPLLQLSVEGNTHPHPRMVDYATRVRATRARTVAAQRPWRMRGHAHARS